VNICAESSVNLGSEDFMFRKIVTTALLSSLVFATATASAAPPSYLDIVGQKSGHIDGGVTLKAHDKSIKVLAVSHDISAAVPSGLPAARRTHKPITVTIEVDAALPLLYNMLVTNENAPKVDLKFPEQAVTNLTGTVSPAPPTFTIHLTNATITDISFVQPDASDVASEKLPLRAVIQLAYQRIEWTWSTNGKPVTDNWAAP
jgi:type VI secretion system secreted protein Hcp